MLDVVKKIIWRKRIFKINSNLMANSKGLQFKIANIDKELEKDLNIGIFQFGDYMAFYINLTAYEDYLNSKGSTTVTPSFEM